MADVAANEALDRNAAKVVEPYAPQDDPLIHRPADAPSLHPSGVGAFCFSGHATGHRPPPRETVTVMTTDATATSGARTGSTRQTDSYVITIANQKGGVGKTMLTLSLAAHTASAHGRALVVDVDPQANAHDLTSVMEDPGYDVLHELDPVQLTQIRRLRDYDTIIVDCPGSLEGHDVLTEVLRRSTYVLIPYDHEPESALPTVRTVERVKELGVPYAVVVTKADPRLGADHILDAWSTLEASGIVHFRSAIRSYRAWPNSLKAGVPITRWNERYAPRLREDVASLHTELLLDLGRRNLVGA